MLHLRTFGDLDLRADDGSVTSVIAQPKRAALLLVLAAAGRDATTRRDSLLALFWPERDTDSARAALRRALHFLRRELGERVIVRVGADALRLDPSEIDVDLWLFDSAMRAGDHARALALASGELVPGFHVNDAPQFDRWLDAKREHVRRDTIKAASNVFAEAIDRNDATAAVDAARRWTEIARDEETSWRALIDAHRAAGDAPAAIAAYNRYATYLREELELEPSPDLAAIAAAPIDQRPSISIPQNAPTESPSALEEPPVVTEARASPERPTLPLQPASASRRRRSSRLALYAASVLALGTAAWSVARSATRTANDPNAPAVVAVLPFAVSDETTQYLGDGLVDLLGLRLDAPGMARSLDASAIFSRYSGTSFSNESDLRKVVTDLRTTLGATRVVIGSVTRVGSSLELAARLLSADGQLLTTATARAADEHDLPAAIDDLARGLLTAVAGHSMELTEPTTQSLDALKAFIAGEREFRAGRFNAAVVSFRAAINADTCFALAYAHLSAALSEATNVQAVDASSLAHAARRFADRLPTVERLLVLGHSEFYAGSAEAAEQYFTAATSAAPEDVEAWIGLGESIFHGYPYRGRPLTLSRRAFERALALDPANPTAIEHLARLDAWEGNADSLTFRARTMRAESSDDVRQREVEALAVFSSNDESAQAQFVRTVAAGSPRDAWRIAWSSAHYSRAFGPAEQLLAALQPRIEPSRRLGLLLVARAHLTAAANHIEGAYALLDSAQSYAPIEALCTRAQLLLLLDPSRVRAGERDAVVRELRAWDGRIASADDWFEEEIPDDGVAIRSYYLARLDQSREGLENAESIKMAPALEAAARGDYSRAIALARQADLNEMRMRRSLRFSRGLNRILVGEWLLAIGEPAKAAEWFSSVPEDRGYDVLLIDRAKALKAVALRQ